MWRERGAVYGGGGVPGSTIYNPGNSSTRLSINHISFRWCALNYRCRQSFLYFFWFSFELHQPKQPNTTCGVLRYGSFRFITPRYGLVRNATGTVLTAAPRRISSRGLLAAEESPDMDLMPARWYGGTSDCHETAARRQTCSLRCRQIYSMVGVGYALLS